MIQIGAPLAHDFSDPLGVLSDCHRRVEHFLHLLIRVTEEARGGELRSEQRDALEVALRYFEEAAAKHTDDEEESVFPRLRAAQRPRSAEALVIIDALTQDHKVARARHAEVETLAHRWLADGHLTPAAAGELAALLHDLSTMYRRHIAIEDEELIPLARQILDASALAALGREMAVRRGLDPHRVGRALLHS